VVLKVLLGYSRNWRLHQPGWLLPQLLLQQLLLQQLRQRPLL